MISLSFDSSSCLPFPLILGIKSLASASLIIIPILSSDMATPTNPSQSSNPIINDVPLVALEPANIDDLGLPVNPEINPVEEDAQSAFTFTDSRTPSEVCGPFDDELDKEVADVLAVDSARDEFDELLDNFTTGAEAGSPDVAQLEQDVANIPLPGEASSSSSSAASEAGPSSFPDKLVVVENGPAIHLSPRGNVLKRVPGTDYFEFEKPRSQYRSNGYLDNPGPPRPKMYWSRDLTLKEKLEIQYLRPIRPSLLDKLPTRHVRKGFGYWIDENGKLNNKFEVKVYNYEVILRK